MAKHRVEIVGHQGTSEGVAPGSLEAYEQAINAGVDMVEVDVRRTSDGEFVGLHDPTMGGRLISHLSLAEINHINGTKVLRIEDLLRLIKEQPARDHPVKLMLDLKDIGGEAEITDLALNHLPGRIVVSTLNKPSVVTLRQSHPDVPVGFSLGNGDVGHLSRTRVSELAPRKSLEEMDANFISAERRLRLSAFRAAKLLRKAKEGDMPVFLWGIKDDEHLRKHIADDRVHAVITDYPERALGYRREYLDSTK